MGDEPLTKVKEESPVTLAANELAEGKFEIIREEGNKEENKEEIKEQSEEQNNEEAKKDTEIEE